MKILDRNFCGFEACRNYLTYYETCGCKFLVGLIANTIVRYDYCVKIDTYTYTFAYTVEGSVLDEYKASLHSLYLYYNER